MKEYILSLAEYVSQVISQSQGTLKNRYINGYSPGGDAQFDVDEIAESAVWQFIVERGEPIAVYSEDKGLQTFGSDPNYLLIVDPIDGTRPAAANLEMCCISIAVAKFQEFACIGDVEYALLKELKTGAYIYGDRYHDELIYAGYSQSLPNLSHTSDLNNMFWSFEFNGHPTSLMINAYGHLIDNSANTGGVFLFNSASYSISRIITGQLDAYVDIGNRLLKEYPETRPAFEKVGKGYILHLFPYDIAASVFLAEKAGVIITDAFGKSLNNTLLMDLSDNNQQSCIAASTLELHGKLLDNIRWQV
ncbi:MAG: inositol monophosphatase family protein [Aphanizomenon sp.]|jgi:myo-inositol-1(or 4)-monophosphatase|uniref:Inorganic polyphosphate kinase n=1 Tax=Aphanizomenon flos-aquae WA102 TaxID=1710896 RepID=A0A1B7X6A8_APHFL|nr:MAG: inorganic polyphosphate kinase [Anabaena sp. WA113]OBQ44895.1 MAG: inorganic polyphosphate kinase [Aphanizomenon flos-aquae WA102]